MTESVFTNRYIKFRKMLIAYRDDLDLSQTDLGERFGKDQSFVSKYERGVRRLDVVEMIDIAEALGVDPRELFERVLKTKR